MRVLVIYAHPVEDSFQAALHRCVVAGLSEAGHDVDDCDLYKEKFQPLLSREERQAYHLAGANTAGVSREVDRLLASDGLVFVFPTWWYGMPAILKGYFDRVWLPGVAFDVVDGRTKPLLRNVKKFAVVTTYGSPFWLNKFYLGDPNRKTFIRGIRHLFSPGVRTLWLAQYGMDAATEPVRRRFIDKVGKKIRSF